MSAWIMVQTGRDYAVVADDDAVADAPPTEVLCCPLVLITFPPRNWLP